MRKIFTILVLFPILLFGQADSVWYQGYSVVGVDTFLTDSASGNPIYQLEVSNADPTMLNSGYISGSEMTINSQPWNTVYSNANYADTTFALFEDITLNSDSTENLPYRLTKFWIFNTAATGSDLTTAYELFNVPTIPSTTYIVPDNYADLAAAQAVAGDGDTILLKDGLETLSSSNINRETLIAIGNYPITYTGSSYAFYTRVTNTGFNNIQIICSTSGGDGILVQGDRIIDFNNNYISTTDGDYAIRTASGATEITLNNNIIDFDGSTDRVIDNIGSRVEFNGNYFKGAGTTFLTTTSDVSIFANYNSFDIDNTGFDLDDYIIDTCNFIGNTITSTGNNTFISINDSLNVFNSRHNIINTEGNYAYLESGSGVDLRFYNDSMNTTSQNAAIKTSGNDLYIEKCYNETNSNGLNVLVDTSSHLNYVDIRNSTFRNNTGSLVSIGNGNLTTDSSYVYGVVTESKFVGDYANTDIAQHCVFIFNNDNFTLSHLEIDSCDLAIVLKSHGVDYSNVNVYGCKIREGRLVLKGCDNVNFFNNTIWVNNNNTECVNSDVNTPYNSNNNNIKNNIFYNNQPDTLTLRALYTFGNGETANISNNVVYNPNGLTIGRVHTTDYNWVNWQGLGYDANSFNTNPNFKSSTQLWPIQPSDAIGNGLDLGSPYNEGLNISSSWPDNVIIRNQLSRWSIGAYVVDLNSIVTHDGFITIGSGGKVVKFNK